MPWYFDAWDVLDGLAFLEERPGGKTEPRLVFVSAPQFIPEPIAKPSTAMAACRSHFQDGLVDPTSGKEVAFETLEQIVEAVRRGYTGGGGNGLVPPPPGPPEAPEEGGGESQVGVEGLGPLPSGEGQSIADIIDILKKEYSTSYVEDLARSLLLVAQSHGTTLQIEKYATDILMTLAVQLERRGYQHTTSDEWETILDALQTSIAAYSAIAIDWREAVETLLRRAGGGRLSKYLMTILSEWEYAYGYPWWAERKLVPSRLLNGALFRMTIPRGWPRHENARSVGGQIYAAAADRVYLLDCLARPGAIATLMLPAIYVGAVATLQSHPRVYSPFRDKYREAILERAMDWLASAMPKNLLNGHPIEKILNEMKYGQASNAAVGRPHGKRARRR